MIIGKIDYINLLPFYIFLKKELKNSSSRKALEFYKGTPAQVNKKFIKRRVEAAVISSIFSPKYRCSDFGIVAYQRVLSVLICPGPPKEDKESNTSNILAKVLGIQGEVRIGDKALLQKNPTCKDLASLWYKKTGLPFVFARFCYHPKKAKEYEALADNFLKSHTKIPTYLLKRYAKRSGVSQKEIRHYLKLIGYKIQKKEKMGLKKFLYLAKRVKNENKTTFTTHTTAVASCPTPLCPHSQKDSLQ